MLKSQLKIAFRNLWRQKGYAFINIAGLAIGIACCILILLYVADEMSYDRYHENADRIYRVWTHGVIGPSEFRGAVTPAPMAEALRNEAPEVETAVRMRSFGFPVIRYEDKVFSEERFFWADSTIFQVFTIPFLQGDPKTALSKPKSVVITESIAQKYFGDENPMGKRLNSDNRRDYEVTGVIKDFPHNSHFHLDFIGSLLSYTDYNDNVWIGNNFYTYVLLHEGATADQLQATLDGFVQKYAAPQLQQATGVSYDRMLEGGSFYGWDIQPLTDIHLHSDLEHEIEPNGNATYVYIFALVAIAILIIACINFMNLATARSSGRAREVGMRKTLGSTRSMLIGQFLVESVVLTAIALFFGLIIVELVLPSYNILTGKQLFVGYTARIMAIPYLILFTFVVGFFAGSYPAFFMASFKPVNVLKGRLESGTSGGRFLRSGLVIFQFAVSIALIAGTLIVSRQLDFIQNKNLGFNKEQIVIIEKTDDIGRQMKAFKNELEQVPDVVSVSNSTHYIGQSFSSNAFRSANAPGSETHLIWNVWTDFDFASTYEIDMKAGRFYSAEFKTDSTALVLNEAAVRVLNLNDPVGKEVIRVGPTPEQSTTHKVIGVVNNFHFESLHYPIRPLIIRSFEGKGFGRYVSVRVKPGRISETLGSMERIWSGFAGNQAFEYFFYDQQFARMYQTEEQTGKLMTVFSGLAIFIACLGLFGLASYTAEKRTKEIGVRKALGATVPGIVGLLFRDIIKLVIIANLIAIPLVIWWMRGWLQNFAYHIEVNWFIFIIPALAAFVVAILTVTYQAVRAALSNPVEALRYE